MRTFGGIGVLGRVPSGSREGRIPSACITFFGSCTYLKWKPPLLVSGILLLLLLKPPLAYICRAPRPRPSAGGDHRESGPCVSIAPPRAHPLGGLAPLGSPDADGGRRRGCLHPRHSACARRSSPGGAGRVGGLPSTPVYLTERGASCGLGVSGDPGAPTPPLSPLCDTETFRVGSDYTFERRACMCPTAPPHAPCQSCALPDTVCDSLIAS